MSKIKILSIAVIALLFINIVIVGFLLLRKPPRFPHGKPAVEIEGPRKIIIKRLDFDAQQTAAYEALISSHRTSIKALEDSIALMKNNLYQTLQGDTLNNKDEIINRLGALQEKIETVNYNHFASIKQLCKPDQLNKFNTLTTELAHFFSAKRNEILPRP